MLRALHISGLRSEFTLADKSLSRNKPVWLRCAGAWTSAPHCRNRKHTCAFVAAAQVCHSLRCAIVDRTSSTNCDTQVT